MWRVRYDQEQNILHLHVSGFWTADMVSEFAVQLHAATAAALQIRPDVDALCESLDFPVQSTEVSELLGAVMRGIMAGGAIRAAIVVGSMLNRLQAERTLIHPDLRIFMNIEDARAWLRTPRTEC